jgi:hypothetical protein
VAVGCRAGDHRLGPAQAGLGRAPCLWPSLPASAPLTEPNLPFLDPTDKFPTGLSTPDFGALLIRPILADQPLGPVNASRASESFLDRGKGPPDARGRSPKGSFLSWKRNPIRTRAPEALASGTFFVPFAHIDRHAGQSPSHPTSWVLGAVAW